MKNSIKYIGINQRIPLEVLDSAIYNYIEDGIIDKQSILQHIKEYTTGENRALKSASHIVKILKRNEKLIKQFKETLNGISYTQINNSDKKAFSLCLYCLTYPIAYDLLVALAIGFKVQPKLNKQFILQKIGAIYGGNRAMDLAVDAIIPLLIELDILKREKIGLYTLSSKLIAKNAFIAELIIYVDIKLSASNSILIDDLIYRAWYSYFEIPSKKIDNNSNLLKSTESIIGKGYLKTLN